MIITTTHTTSPTHHLLKQEGFSASWGKIKDTTHMRRMKKKVPQTQPYRPSLPPWAAGRHLGAWLRLGCIWHYVPWQHGCVCHFRSPRYVYHTTAPDAASHADLRSVTSVWLRRVTVHRERVYVRANSKSKLQCRWGFGNSYPHLL